MNPLRPGPCGLCSCTVVRCRVERARYLRLVGETPCGARRVAGTSIPAELRRAAWARWYRRELTA